EVDALTLETLGRAVTAFGDLLEAAAKDSAGNRLVTWDVTHLDAGSFHGRFVPVAERPEIRSSVLHELSDVAESISHGNGVLTSERYARPARAVLALAELAPVEITVLDREISVGPGGSVKMAAPT